MKIDIFNHVVPPKYKDALEQKVPKAIYGALELRCNLFPDLIDYDKRFATMDKHSGMAQVISILTPFVERLVPPQTAIELIKLGNDELAGLVSKYPDRFVAAIGNLPMNDFDASLDEIDRVIEKMKFRGIQICTDINGKPLDSPEFLPLFEKMEKFDLPVYLHPVRPPNVPDYATEDTSKFVIHQSIGWPYDTTAAMIRLVLGKVMDKHPKLKIVTHHCGAMLPYFYKRILNFLGNPGMEEYVQQLSSPPIEYFKKFYNDTAITGNTSGLMCAYDFFGADHILFGTDMPLGSHKGHSTLDDVVESVEQMKISDGEKQKIFESNAKKLLKLNLK